MELRLLVKNFMDKKLEEANSEKRAWARKEERLEDMLTTQKSERDKLQKDNLTLKEKLRKALKDIQQNMTAKSERGSSGAGLVGASTSGVETSIKAPKLSEEESSSSSSKGNNKKNSSSTSSATPKTTSTRTNHSGSVYLLSQESSKTTTTAASTAKNSKLNVASSSTSSKTNSENDCYSSTTSCAEENTTSKPDSKLAILKRGGKKNYPSSSSSSTGTVQPGCTTSAVSTLISTSRQDESSSPCLLANCHIATLAGKKLAADVANRKEPRAVLGGSGVGPPSSLLSNRTSSASGAPTAIELENKNFLDLVKYSTSATTSKSCVETSSSAGSCDDADRSSSKRQQTVAVASSSKQKTAVVSVTHDGEMAKISLLSAEELAELGVGEDDDNLTEPTPSNKAVDASSPTDEVVLPQEGEEQLLHGISTTSCSTTSATLEKLFTRNSQLEKENKELLQTNKFYKEQLVPQTDNTKNEQDKELIRMATSQKKSEKKIASLWKQNEELRWQNEQLSQQISLVGKSGVEQKQALAASANCAVGTVAA
ncbi:unnamed protein product [Amoebophrya sp. A120]|nr:unnamed protein product [Amoebophrya sp. A120]|eukprot:GSA120T00014179001.1